MEGRTIELSRRTSSGGVLGLSLGAMAGQISFSAQKLGRCCQYRLLQTHHEYVARKPA